MVTKQLVDYQSWKSADFSIEDLQLDPFNLRVPDKSLDVSEIIEYLIEHEDLLSLVENISTLGYLPIQIMIVYEEGGEMVVLEGNRRLAACLLLSNPNLAPQKNRSEIENLSRNISKSVKILHASIAPSRADADLIIAKIHAKSSTRPWSTISKNNFYFLKIDEGMSVDEICSTYNFSKSDVTKALVAHNVYQYAKVLEFPEDVQQIISEPRKFNFSTFQRLFESAAGKKFFGITSNADGEIKISEGEEFKKRLIQAIIDVSRKKINSRTLNTTADKEKYFSEISSENEDEQKNKKQLKQSSVRTTTATQTSEPNKGQEIQNDQPSNETIEIIPVNFIPKTKGEEEKKQYEISYRKAPSVVEFIFDRFPDVVTTLSRRPGKKDAFVQSEDDIQHLMHGVLKIFFPDAEREAPTQRKGLTSSRIDILLPQHKIAIEMKITNSKTDPQTLQKELFEDIPLHRNHSECKRLFFYVYDRGDVLDNKVAIKKAVESEPLGKLELMKVVINK